MVRTIQTSSLYYFFAADTRSVWLWLIARVWLGYEWFMAGWEKSQEVCDHLRRRERPLHLRMGHALARLKSSRGVLRHVAAGVPVPDDLCAHGQRFRVEESVR